MLASPSSLVKQRSTGSLLGTPPHYVAMKQKLQNIPFPRVESHFLLQSSVVWVLLACLWKYLQSPHPSLSWAGLLQWWASRWHLRTWYCSSHPHHSQSQWFPLNLSRRVWGRERKSSEISHGGGGLTAAPSHQGNISNNVPGWRIIRIRGLNFACYVWVTLHFVWFLSSLMVPLKNRVKTFQQIPFQADHSVPWNFNSLVPSSGLYFCSPQSPCD